MQRAKKNSLYEAIIVFLYFAVIKGCFVPLELSVPRPGSSMAIVDDKIYFVGMQDAAGVGTSDLVDILDTKQNQWSTMRLPTSRRQILTLAVGQYILFIGGFLADGTYQAQIDIFDTHSGSTRSIPAELYVNAYLRGIAIGSKAIIYGDTILIVDPENLSASPIITDRVVGATTNGTHLICMTNINNNLMVDMYDVETRIRTGQFPSPVRAALSNFGMYFAPSSSAIVLISGNGQLNLISLAGQLILSQTLPVINNRFGHVMINNELYTIEPGQIVVTNFERSTSTRYNLPQRFYPAVTNIIAHNGIIYATSTTRSLASVLTINTAALLTQTAVPLNVNTAISGDIVYWTTFDRIISNNLLTSETKEIQYLPRPQLQATSERYLVFAVSTLTPQIAMLDSTTNQVRTIVPPTASGRITIITDDYLIWQSHTWTFYFYNILLDQWTTEVEIPEAAGLQPHFANWNMLFFAFNNRNAILAVNMDTGERLWQDTEQRSMVSWTSTDTLMFLTSYAEPSTQVVIFNKTDKSFTTARLSTPRANVKLLTTPEYVLFGEGTTENGDLSTRIDIYDIEDAFWTVLDMPTHFLAGELAMAYLDNFVYLFRTQRVDRLDLTRRTFTQLSFPIDTVVQTRVRGSKIIAISRNSFTVYETTTGEWFYSTNQAPNQLPRVTSSFVLVGETGSSRFFASKRFTTALNAISNSAIFRGQSHEFSVDISGPYSRVSWNHELSTLSDQTDPTLMLTNVSESADGKYTVEIFDQCNQRIRQDATLTVNGPPEFIANLIDTVSLCHKTTTIQLSTFGQNVSYTWTINGVVQPTTSPVLAIMPAQLSCGVLHQICMTATNPAGSAITCANLKLVEYDTIFDGPQPTTVQHTWFSEMTVTLQVAILEEDCTNHAWFLDGIQISQDFIDAESSTIAITVTRETKGRRYTVKARCGSATAESMPFIFESVSSLTVPILVIAIVAPVSVVVVAIVAGVIFRRKLLAKQEKEIELQSLLTQAKTESLARDVVSVIPSTTWEWMPTDEYTYCPLDSLPGKINVSMPSVAKEPVKVDTWTQHEISFYAPPSSSIFRAKKKKYSLLHEDGVRIDIYSPQSPKYEIKVEPASFLLEEDKQLNLTLSVKMRMTAKCKICLIIVFDQQKIYSALEFKLASTMSTWIDLAEIEMTGEHLGGGGFGSVSRGIYRGQEVAVKRLLSQHLNDEMKIEFEREVTLMKDLRHPNIVQFIGASNVTDNFAIVIEYAPMGSLSSVMQKMKLSYSMKITILVEIAKALQFLHLNRIVHRDIKPQNILVFSLQPKTPVHIKLTDFGTSRFIAEDIMTVTKNVGTISYMAPEALGKNPRIDMSADVYSFAILMWEVIYEQQPFIDFEWQSDIEIHIKSGKRLALEHRAGINADIIELIEDCWHQDPAQRPLMNTVVQRLSALM